MDREFVLSNHIPERGFAVNAMWIHACRLPAAVINTPGMPGVVLFQPAVPSHL